MTTATISDIDMTLEVVVIAVSDVDRAIEFYGRLGWRQDRTPPGSGIVQFTPHGSSCSIQFGTNLTTARPGSGSEYLIVSDIAATLEALAAAGVEIDEVYHIGPEGTGPGLDPDRRTYRSRAVFHDPDGNAWLLQEITTRLPGRLETSATSYCSMSALEAALRRASNAHAEREDRTGEADANWPEWYAQFMVSEKSGAPLPT
jgi:catechol 2,3-dioxygenase-like lactoylglutathione lyase family enzyme